MGIIWYFELLAFALDLDDKEQRSLYFFDFLNMMQVLDITPVVLPDSLSTAGSLGVPHLRLQEERAAGGDHEV